MHAPHSHMNSNHPPKVSTDPGALSFAVSPRAATAAASETAEEVKLSLVALLLGLELVEKRKQTNKTKNKGSAQLLNNNNNNNNKQ